MSAARARVVHRMPGRVRLRIREKRHDRGFFTTLTEAIAQQPGVRRATANPQTGSVLIEHDGEFDPILAQLKGQDILLVEAEPTGSATANAVRNLRLNAFRLDLGLRHITGKEADLRSSIILLLAFLTIIQALRGQILPPAITVAWYTAMLAAAKDL
jgi:hypothetical protein